jgi:hypothetical protein
MIRSNFTQLQRLLVLEDSLVPFFAKHSNQSKTTRDLCANSKLDISQGEPNFQLSRWLIQIHSISIWKKTHPTGSIIFYAGWSIKIT